MNVWMMPAGVIVTQTNTSQHGWMKIMAYWLVRCSRCRPASAPELKSVYLLGKPVAVPLLGGERESCSEEEEEAESLTTANHFTPTGTEIKSVHRRPFSEMVCVTFSCYCQVFVFFFPPFRQEKSLDNIKLALSQSFGLLN